MLEKKFAEDTLNLEAGPRLSLQFAESKLPTTPAPTQMMETVEETAETEEVLDAGEQVAEEPEQPVQRRVPRREVNIWDEKNSVVTEDVGGRKVVKAGNLDQLIIYLTRPNVNLDGQ